MTRVAIFASVSHPTGSRPEGVAAGAPVTGNRTTLHRLSAGLRARGIDVVETLLPPGEAPDEREIERLTGSELLHALHAFRTGRAVREIARRSGVPYVVSVTGTDVHDDLRNPARREEVIRVLTDARAILAATAEPESELRAVLGLRVPWVVVPKGVAVPPPEAREGAAARGPPIFLHVAGWREVKNNLFPLEPLSRLAREAPLRLRFVGPVLDDDYHARWLEVRGLHPFAEDAGTIDPDAMGSEYAAASVVLNTSHHEGGSNAVLEAMAAGRTVLASDVPGNAAFIRYEESRWDGSTGVLYATRPAAAEGKLRRIHDPEDFLRKARRLLLEPGLRERISRNAREEVLQRHSPEREIEKVLEAYRLAGLPV